jgi:Na+-translocating ferredoxin:NAD+ oxidoreductase RnfE subunit
MLIGIGSMLVLIALGSREEIIGLVALVVLSAVAFWLTPRREPVRP